MYGKFNTIPAGIRQVIPVQAPDEHASQAHLLGVDRSGPSAPHVSRIGPLVLVVGVEHLGVAVVDRDCTRSANQLTELWVERPARGVADTENGRVEDVLVLGIRQLKSMSSCVKAYSKKFNCI